MSAASTGLGAYTCSRVCGGRSSRIAKEKKKGGGGKGCWGFS